MRSASSWPPAALELALPLALALAGQDEPSCWLGGLTDLESGDIAQEIAYGLVGADALLLGLLKVRLGFFSTRGLWPQLYAARDRAHGLACLQEWQ